MKGNQEFKTLKAVLFWHQALSSLFIITLCEESHRIYGRVEASKTLTNRPDEGGCSGHFHSGGKSVSLCSSSCGNKYSDRVHYIIRYHRSMLHLKRSKVALNISAPLKILKDSAFTESAISLRASLIVSSAYQTQPH